MFPFLDLLTNHTWLYSIETACENASEIIEDLLPHRSKNAEHQI